MIKITKLNSSFFIQDTGVPKLYMSKNLPVQLGANNAVSVFYNEAAQTATVQDMKGSNLIENCPVSNFEIDGVVQTSTAGMRTSLAEIFFLGGGATPATLLEDQITLGEVTKAPTSNAVFLGLAQKAAKLTAAEGFVTSSITLLSNKSYLIGNISSPLSLVLPANANDGDCVLIHDFFNKADVNSIQVMGVSGTIGTINQAGQSLMLNYVKNATTEHWTATANVTSEDGRIYSGLIPNAIASSSVEFYLTKIASTVPNFTSYYNLTTTPNSTAVQSFTVGLLNGLEILLADFISPVLGRNLITAGIYQATFFANVDHEDENPKLEARFFVLKQNGTQSSIGTITTNTIQKGATTSAVTGYLNIASDISIDITDRFIMQVYAKMDAPLTSKTINFTLDCGIGKNSRITTPLIIGHDQLSGLNATTSDFQHLSRQEKERATRIATDAQDGLMSKLQAEELSYLPTVQSIRNSDFVNNIYNLPFAAINANIETGYANRVVNLADLAINPNKPSADYADDIRIISNDSKSLFPVTLKFDRPIIGVDNQPIAGNIGVGVNVGEELKLKWYPVFQATDGNLDPLGIAINNVYKIMSVTADYAQSDRNQAQIINDLVLNGYKYRPVSAEQTTNIALTALGDGVFSITQTALGGVTLALDGKTFALTGQTNKAQNGIYTVAGLAPSRIQRAGTFDNYIEINNAVVQISGGNRAGKWVLFTASDIFTINTTEIFTQEIAPQTFKRDITASASVTELTAIDPSLIEVSGTTTHTVKLPDATLLTNGITYRVVNKSTGSVSITTQTNVIIFTISPNTDIQFYLQNNSTQAGVWSKLNVDPASTTLTGDITGTGVGSVATTIANNVVGNTKLSQMPTNTLKGNNTGATANATDLTIAQINAMISTNKKVIYVSGNSGSDTNNGRSPDNAVLTLNKALTLVDGSGWCIAIFPATYTVNETITTQNLTIVSAHFETGGLANLTGSITVSNTAGSVRLVGLNIQTLTHAGAGSLYIFRSTTTTFSKTGSGYLQGDIWDSQSNQTGTISITGSGAVNILNGSLVGALSINNASAQVNISNNLTCYPINLLAGTLGINNTPVYSATSTSNAITAASGTILYLTSVSTLTPANASARISLATGSAYSFTSSVIDRANSTLNGTLLTRQASFDSVLISASNVITNANLSTVPTQTFKGRTTTGTGAVEDLTSTQATAMLSTMVGDSGSGGTKGLVPAPASGDSSKFLKGDGTWGTPAGGGGTASFDVDYVSIDSGVAGEIVQLDVSGKVKSINETTTGTSNTIANISSPTVISNFNSASSSYQPITCIVGDKVITGINASSANGGIQVQASSIDGSSYGVAVHPNGLSNAITNTWVITELIAIDVSRFVAVCYAGNGASFQLVVGSVAGLSVSFADSSAIAITGYAGRGILWYGTSILFSYGSVPIGSTSANTQTYRIYTINTNNTFTQSGAQVTNSSGLTYRGLDLVRMSDTMASFTYNITSSWIGTITNNGSGVLNNTSGTINIGSVDADNVSNINYNATNQLTVITTGSGTIQIIGTTHTAGGSNPSLKATPQFSLGFSDTIQYITASRVGTTEYFIIFYKRSTQSILYSFMIDCTNYIASNTITKVAGSDNTVIVASPTFGYQSTSLGYYYNKIYPHYQGKTIVQYSNIASSSATTRNTVTSGNSMFINKAKTFAIRKANVNANGTGTVITAGGTADLYTNLIVGNYYFVGDDKRPTSTPNAYPLGMALTSTKLSLNPWYAIPSGSTTILNNATSFISDGSNTSINTDFTGFKEGVIRMFTNGVLSTVLTSSYAEMLNIRFMGHLTSDPTVVANTTIIYVNTTTSTIRVSVNGTAFKTLI